MPVPSHAASCYSQPLMGKVVLGRGLGALIQPRTAPAGNEAAAVVQPELAPGETIQQVALDQIRSSPFQPRQEFKPETLGELIESIRERGIIQPLIVRQVNGHYELIAGERRWRAAQSLGLAKAPVILRQATDQEVLELALIENPPARGSQRRGRSARLRPPGGGV